MATGMMCNTPKKQESAEWTSLFQSDLKTEQQSVIFVKRMMALAVSSITYLRGIFPEDAYRSRYLDDLCIKVLREDCKTPGACKIVKWMMGCFDALEKGYLQIVFIGVHTDPEDPNVSFILKASGTPTHTNRKKCIIESYQFKFRYTEKGPQMDILRNKNIEMQVTMEDTKKASILLIRKLFLLMQNLDILPNGVCLTMKLYYFDDITPADYEPPGFKEGVCDNLWFEGMAVHFRVGEVETPFHNLKVRVAAEQSRVEKLQEGNNLKACDQVSTASQSTLPALTAREATGPDAEMPEVDELPSEDESAQFKKPKKSVSKRKGAQNQPKTKKGKRAMAAS